MIVIVILINYNYLNNPSSAETDTFPMTFYPYHVIICQMKEFYILPGERLRLNQLNFKLIN